MVWDSISNMRPIRWRLIWLKILINMSQRKKTNWRGRIKVVPKWRRNKSSQQRTNQVYKMNQNLMVRKEKQVKVSVGVIATNVVVIFTMWLWIVVVLLTLLLWIVVVLLTLLLRRWFKNSVWREQDILVLIGLLGYYMNMLFWVEMKDSKKVID